MVLMWMEFRCETRFLAELPLPVVEWFPPGFIGCANAWQAFFSGFSTTDYADRMDPRKRAAGICRSRLRRRASTIFHQPQGRGAGVGRGRGVGACLGVGVGLAVAVGVADAVAVAVGVADAVGVAVAVGVGEGDAQGLTGQVKISIESNTVTPSDA